MSSATEQDALAVIQQLKAGELTIADLMGPLHGQRAGLTVSLSSSGKEPAQGWDPIASEEFAVSPMDASNTALLANVHPPDYQNPAPCETYDVIVIGAGVAGLLTVIMASALGAKCALIERALMGGDCLNVGCVPSKALIACAKRLHDVQTAGDFGIAVSGSVTVDFAAVMQRMRKIRAEISVHDSVERYSRDFCEHVFLGQAEFTSSTTLRVAGTELRFKKAMIATGASALVPDQLRGLPYLSNANFFNLEAMPGRLLVLGAGPIGIELAQSMARFGCAVTVLQRGDRILAKEDPEASALLQGVLHDEGVSFALGAELISVELLQEGELYTAPFQQYRVTYSVASSDATAGQQRTEHTLECDAVLVAAGRVPNVRDLGLSAAGVEADLQRGVHIDDSFKTSMDNIYACGDCATPFKFTHAADWQARIAVRNMLLGRELPAGACGGLSSLLVPAATYTDPEVAHVGLTEAELQRTGVQYEVLKRELSAVDRCRCEGITSGFVKLLVRSSSSSSSSSDASEEAGQLLGATIVAPNAGDMISELTVALQSGVAVHELAGVMHPYPTVQEAVRQAAAGGNKAKYTTNDVHKTALQMLVQSALASST